MTTYFDHNATSPLDSRVQEVMIPYLSCANPSSAHSAGRKIRRAVEQAREQVAALVGVQPGQVIFTSGGTEANNFVLSGFAANVRPGAIVVSTVEHPSVLEPANALSALGWTVETIPVDAQGRIDVVAADELLTDSTRMVSVMGANNETGVLQPVAELAEIARARGIVVHSDAVQVAGKLPLSFDDYGADAISLSAHKLNGPKGIGALIVNKKLDLRPLIRGGGQEKGMRSGTENVAAIVGFGLTAELARHELFTRAAITRDLRDYFIGRLDDIPGSQVFGEGASRLPNTVMFSLPGINGETALLQLDRKGFAVSSGSACHSASADPSHVLKAMGVAREVAFSAVRVSFGHENSRTEVDGLIAALKKTPTALAPGLTERSSTSTVSIA